MEAATSRGVSLPVSSSQPLRKEWRAVSQDQEHPKLGQSDERTIYEEGAGPLGVDFCSMTIDEEGTGDDMLQDRLQEIAQQHEELHQMEVLLRSRAIARSEILAVQNGYEARVKEHADAVSNLKGQLQEREQQILELEMKLDNKDREIRSMKIDNEAAWAKEDLLREQNKEIATFRRERDNSDAERVQHLQKIHELQELIQEKDSQFLALEEQHRVAQETLHFKDEQLREAQTWIARAQEVDALHSTTNQNLQAELRERIEQFNQYYYAFPRQFAEMERHHLQAIQQLQLELAEARDKSGSYKDGSQVARENSIDSSSRVQNKGSQINVNGGAASNGNLGLISNGNLDTAPSLTPASSASTKSDHVSGVVPVIPSSILGMGAFLPPGQMTSLHPFVMHPQAVLPSVSPTNPPNPQPHIGHLQPVPTMPLQHWPNEQAIQDISLVASQNKHQPTQMAQNLLRSDAQHGYGNSSEGQVVHSDHLNTSINQHQRSGHVINIPSVGVQVLDSNGNKYHVSHETQETENRNLQLHASLGYDPSKQKSEQKAQDENLVSTTNQARDQVISAQQQAASSVVSSTAESHPVSSNTSQRSDSIQISGSSIPGKTVEPTLIDERSLLACIVRAIPAGSDGRIRISSTLPNRLGKMLAPLHWHDYKKYYGKLDDFVARHPELFVIEGDFIHLREGAQEIISASTAYAKVAAAAAASSTPHSSLLPSVAVTPVAQNSRHKKAPSTDLKPESTVEDLNVSSKTKDLQEVSGLPEKRPSHLSVHKPVGNVANLDRAALPSSQNNGVSNGRHGFGGRQQGRSSGAGLISRRQN